ncbi:MAG: hypothetical protein IT374_15300 [Polyangiaceae bacterium]|nr:hypothetical protein [Polyangiaceae bacterium]
MRTSSLFALSLCWIASAACSAGSSSSSSEDDPIPGTAAGHGASGASGRAGAGAGGGAGTSGAAGGGAAGASEAGAAGKSGASGAAAGAANNAGAAGSSAGSSAAGAAGSTGCVPPTGASLGKNCGPVTDPKCGGVIDCGGCPSGEKCGADGKPNVCGTGVSTCVPTTCAQLGKNCGSVSDGCNGLLDCGKCGAGEACGVVTPAVCGPDTGSCTPKTCASQGVGCGPAGDGCGQPLDCGACPQGTTCGGGGVPGACGAPTCVPQTCQSQGVTCGVVGDGCGGSLSCGSCAAPQICGGGGTAGKCGCTGVCAGVVTCPGNQKTTLSGKVYDPAGNNPLYNALVYVPNTKTPLPPFSSTLTCDQCGATAAGDPLVTAYTQPDGSFALSNVPVGADIPLVVQLGHWRMQYTIDITNACGNTTVTDKSLRMPRNRGEGDIPRMALVTGSVDGLECVLRKMGVDDAEFGNPGSASRIHLYSGDDVGVAGQTTYGRGATINGSTPSQAALFSGSTPAIMGYDMTLLACQGLPAAKVPAQQAALQAYAAAGGRVFATHYSYPWLTNKAYAVPQGTGNGPYESVATWNHHPYGNPTPDPASVNVATNPRGPAFLAWLQAVNALPLEISQARWDVDAVVPPTQEWITDTKSAPHFPLHFTFNTPLGAASSSQCGRVLFSDFHVLNAYNYGKTFPAECDSSPMSAQEKILEFMIFDLGSCVQPYTPVCTPTTCAAQGIQCGAAGDGCGGALDCGVCTTGTCGGGGQPGKCGAPTCTPITCANQGIQCGPAGDGCGKALDCGECVVGVCGGGGKPGVCGQQTCTPRTCGDQGVECGPAGDGCGKPLDCGDCPPGKICGVGGPGKCGAPTCTPITCAQQGVECGPAGDGCGNKLDCGQCEQGEICGFGAPGKCGEPKP